MPPDTKGLVSVAWEDLHHAQQDAWVKPPLPYTLHVDGVGLDAKVSLAATQVSPQPLLVDLFTRLEIDFVFDFCAAEGALTGVWESCGARDLIEQLLAPSHLQMDLHQLQDGHTLCVIQERPLPLPSSTPASTTTIYRELMPCYQMASNLQSNLLVGSASSQAIYPAGNSAGLTVGMNMESNRLFFRGPEEEVRRAVQMVQKADLPLQHVLFDCYFLRVNQNYLAELGLQLTLLQGPNQFYNVGNLPGAAFDPNALLSAFVQYYLLPSTDRPLLLSLLQDGFGRGGLEALISASEIRTQAREQALALNGQQAVFQVGRNGYLLLTTYSSGIPSVSTQTIETGAIITLTPTILPNQTVRVDTQIEFSEFTESGVSRIAANKTQAVLHSISQVRSGQPIVLGGIWRTQSSISDQGYPGLRLVPIIDLIGGASVFNPSEQQIIIAIIPRIVEPRLHSPLLQINTAIQLVDEPVGVHNIPRD
ncbi:MAG: type II secretion system protein GspD [Chlamydiia bacterium]